MRYNYGRPKPVASTIRRLPVVILLIAIVLFIAADLLLEFDFNWVDYAIIIVIALFGLKGYFKGLVNTVLSLAGYIVSLVAAYMFSSKLALLLMEKTQVGQTIGSKINEVIPSLSLINTVKISEAQSVMNVIGKNSELQSAVMSNPLLNQMLQSASAAADTGAYADSISTLNELIVFYILKIIALIVIFIAVKLIVYILSKLITSAMDKNAMLGTANRTGGMVIGLATGLLICYVVFFLILPTLASINIIKLPETYSGSVVMGWFNKLVLLII